MVDEIADEDWPKLIEMQNCLRSVFKHHKGVVDVDAVNDCVEIICRTVNS